MTDHKELADGLMDAGIGVWSTPHWRSRVSDIDLRDAIEAALDAAYRRGVEDAARVTHPCRRPRIRRLVRMWVANRLHGFSLWLHRRASGVSYFATRMDPVFNRIRHPGLPSPPTEQKEAPRP